MKPTPLPPKPTLVDCVEYGLQWLLCLVIVHDPKHPVLSGLLTSVWVMFLGLIIILIISLLR